MCMYAIDIYRISKYLVNRSRYLIIQIDSFFFKCTVVFLSCTLQNRLTEMQVHSLTVGDI